MSSERVQQAEADGGSNFGLFHQDFQSKTDAAVKYLALATFFAVIAALASAYHAEDMAGAIYGATACAMLVVLLGYILYRGHQKLHRFAPAIGYLQMADKIVKEHLAQIAFSEEVDTGAAVNASVTKILNTIATTFTMITGKRCYCSIKQLESGDDGDVARTVAIDSLSDTYKKTLNYVSPVHRYSSLRELLTGKDPTGVYIRNNLPRDWRRKTDGQRDYDNPLFDVFGEPVETKSWFGRTTIDWRLPFRSSLVVPIRHVLSSNISIDIPSANEVTQQGQEVSHIWGFLCIHCESTNVFDRRYLPQLANAFSDILYILLSLSALFSKSNLEDAGEEIKSEALQS